MEVITAPYTIFGITKEIPVVTFTDGVEDKEPKSEWKDTLWVEREEEYYAFLNKKWAAGTIRVVRRDVWLRSKEGPGGGKFG